jgi:hypothetical protein
MTLVSWAYQNLQKSPPSWWQVTRPPGSHNARSAMLNLNTQSHISSAATIWALYSLAIRPDIQSKLREEVLSLSTENPTIDELNSLKYLEFVIRETLRLHTPVSSTIRVSDKDGIIPLSTPFVDKRGKSHHGVR